MASRRNELTELELCVLGAIWLRGPCSAYAIRREFAESTSSFWSSSAGSIYPVIHRLLAARLVAVKADTSDGRGTREITATESGRRALIDWIADPPAWTGKASLDPIRTRINFIAVLPDVAAQRKFVARAEELTSAELAERKASRNTESREDAERLAALGAICELEGRLKWLRAVRKALARGPIRLGREG
jgi:DNA-binding PadR family transcriptional regulator